MDIDRFVASLQGVAPPQGLPALAQALWYDAHGDWARAHRITQGEDTATAAHVHAYLHRKEGDIANADYWYRRAGRARPDTTLDAEWRSILEFLLVEGG